MNIDKIDKAYEKMLKQAVKIASDKPEKTKEKTLQDLLKGIK